MIPEGRTQHVLRNRVLALAACALAGLALLWTAVAAPAAPARAGYSPAPAVTASLEGVYEAALHVPAADMGGIRSGTLHTGSAAGREWAIASFTPARSAAKKVAVNFQDGAATGVFTKAGGTWRLVQTGLYGCGDGLPASLKSAWHLADPAACSPPATAQRASAQRALAALPAAARAAAKTASTTKTATAPAATSTAGLSQQIAAIALSQVGVEDTPAVTNFNGVACDPYSTLVAGFSADSDGCGYDTGFGVENENETWCSDFNKWVWERAGIA